MSAHAFELPRALEATAPPEQRGLARDEVRLLVAERGSGALEHGRFRDLPGHLRAGDLLVVNTSATLPAAVPGTLAGREPVELRFATAAPDLELHGSWWIVELRSPDGACPYRGAAAGQRVALPGDTEVELVAPYAGGARLWLARRQRTRCRCASSSPPTATRSATATSRASGRSTPTRPSSPPSPAAPRCRAPAARSRPS